MQSVSNIMSRKFLRPFSCIGVIYIIYQLSGFEVVYAYTENFFEESGVELEPSLAALLAGTQYDINGTLEEDMLCVAEL